MFTTRPELLGTFGVVATTHWLASAAGMAMLEKGGNAFDAAVAAGFVLHIAEPHLNGPGGDMPVLIYDRASDAYRMICGQGVTCIGVDGYFEGCVIECTDDSQCPREGYECRTMPQIAETCDPKFCLMTDDNML